LGHWQATIISDVEETSMARYSVKLVDRAGLSTSDEHAIQTATQKRFDEAFDGTSDGVDVSWGSGAQSDNLVVHFVADRDHSYIKQKWADANIALEAGGHTYTGARPMSASEVYRKRDGGDFHFGSYAATVVHEAMHNLYPFQSADFVHKQDGGGAAAGLAAAIYSRHTHLTEHNKELLRKGFAVKNPQYL
jgi:hypothetical protein